MSKKSLTNNERITMVQEKLNSEYKVISVREDILKSGKKKYYYTIKHISEYCGNHVFEIRGDKCKGKICPICDTKYKKNTCSFKHDVAKLVGDEYTVLGEYINNKTKIDIIHNSCGEIYNVSPEKFLNGNRCTHCGKRKKYSEDEIKNIIKNASNSEYEMVGSYRGYGNNNSIKHHKCGNIWDTTLVNLLGGEGDNKVIKHGCPFCSGNDKKNLEYYKEKVDRMTNGEFTVLESIDYINNRSPIEIRHNCEKCDYHVWQTRPDNFMERKRCPACTASESESAGERELRAYIESLVECYEKEYSKGILDGKEIDILTKNNIGFEYNGNYWHKEIDDYTEESRFKPIGYHKDKIKKAKEKDIILYHIWESQWKNNKDKVKEFIKKALGL